MAHARRIATDGIWYQWTSPLAMHRAGKTFTGSVSRSGNIVVAAIDAASGDIEQHVVSPGLNADDHAAPAVFVRRPDDRLVVVYGKHNDPILRWRISSHPLDVSSWGPEKTFEAPRNTAYPQLVQLQAEHDRIYMFFRHAIVGGDQRDWAFLTSDDGAETFSGLTTLRVNFYSHSKGVLNPYTVVASDGVARIDFASTNYEQLAKGGRPNSIYHWYYEAGRFHRSDGSLIGTASDLPIASESDLTVITDAPDVNLWDISYDANGRPVIAWVKFEDYDHGHVAVTANWNGATWDIEPITPLGGPVSNNPGREWYSGGVALHRSNARMAYLSSQSAYGHFNVSKWEHTGEGWVCRQRLTGDATRKNFRPVAPRDADESSVEVLFVGGAYQDLLEYGPTSILAFPGLPNQPAVAQGFRGALRVKRKVQALPQEAAAGHVPFEKNIYDTYRFWQSATGFVIPPGIQAIRVSASIRLAEASSDAQLDILRNGARHPGMATSTVDGSLLAAASAVLLVAEGDQLSCRVLAPGNRIEADDATWFAVEVVE